MNEQLISEDERLRILMSLNSTSRKYPRDRCIHQEFEDQASRTPHVPAIIYEEKELSYQQFNERANQLAHYLIQLGVGPDALVGVYLERSVEMVVSLYAILKAGGAYIPFEPDYPIERIKAMLSDAHPHVVITTKALQVRLLGSDVHLVCLDDCAEIERQDKKNPDVGLASNNLAYVIYTSGSTGVPKGALNTHGGIYNGLRWMQDEYQISSQDRMLQKTPFSFDVSVCEFFWPLMYGGLLVVARPGGHRDPEYLTRTIVDQKISTMHIVPSMLDLLLEHKDVGSCQSLKRVICSGEALSMATQRRFFTKLSAELHNLYGPAEAAVHVTFWACRSDDRGEVVPIGRPIANTQIHILDATGIPVPIGESGEIFIGGENVGRGYLNRPDLTAEKFIFDPFNKVPGRRMYRTGDLARWREDGSIDYMGRIDYQVKIRGQRVELGEIEAVLAKHPSIRQCVVVAREESSGDKRLAAYIVVGRDRDVIDTQDVLVSFLKKYLPDHMIPVAFVKLDALPLNANGKIDRVALPVPRATDLAHEVGGEVPRDELEREMSKIFADVLGTDVETRESNFFRLGGHSLLAWRIVLFCQERLSVALSVNSVFSHPNVAALADAVRQERERGPSTAEVMRVPRGGKQQLTPQQYALWLDLKLHPDAYNEPVAFRTTTRLAPKRVRNALERLSSTHEILRARIVEQAGEPHFIFDGTLASLEFEVQDETFLDLQTVLVRPFDLAHGPLWRAVLHQDPSGGSVLLLVVHHMILDAASVEILLRDFVTTYANPATALPARAYDFCDLAVHERECLAQEQPALERFWAATLAGAELTPELPPPCVPCRPGEEKHGGSTRRTVSPSLARSIRALAADLETTPFHVYLAAYLALLRTYTASDDLVIGSPVSLRDTPAAQDVVGYLLNPVALRVQLAGDRSFRETVEEVSRRWQEVRAHSRLPMHLLLTPHSEQRIGVGSPIQVFFSLIHDSLASLSIDGQPLLPVHVPSPQVKFQLFLLVEERAEDATLVLEFQRGALDPEMAERLLVHLERLLRAATIRVDTPLSQLPLMEWAELEQLRTFGSNKRPYAQDSSVPDLFEDVVRRAGDSTALVAGTSHISYAVLDRRANAVATILMRAGVARGDRVPLLLDRGAHFIASALGVMKCGAAFVPLDPTYPPERLARMLEGLGIQVGLCSGDTALLESGISWLDASCADAESDADVPPREITATDPAYVMFTSGSTGRPKGVEVPHRAIVRLVQGQDFARMGPQETWLHMAPTSFDASTLEIWAALLHGGRCVVLEEASPTPDLLAETIRRNGVTSAWFTASLFNAIVEEAPGTFAGLQQILVGGEALSPSHLRRAIGQFPDSRFVNGYGPTENTTFTCCHVICREDLESGRAIPIGRPIANSSVFVLDRDGHPVPIGIPGELVAGGDGVALGYAGQPAKSKEKFLSDTLSGHIGGQLYRTGDRVRWRADGVIEFLGRLDEQVKIRGHRIEPGEIAACLGEHLQVRHAAVVPRRAASGATQLVAYVVPQNGASAAELPEILASHTAERLPAYMLPATFVIVPRLPLKPNGKLDVKALETAAHSSSQKQQHSPLTPTQAVVIAIWRDVLRNPDLGVDDDFFQSGGDSLLAIRMLARVESEVGARISVRALIEGRTLRRVVASIADSTSSSMPRGVVRLRELDAGRPLFCLPGLGGVALQFERMAAMMRARFSVLAIDLHELHIDPKTLESMTDTSVAVAKCMREVQARGPYAILGYSYGGNLAVEVARELMRQGEQVEPVIVLDAYAPGSARDQSVLKKIATHLRILSRLGLGDAFEYLSYRVLRRLGLRAPLWKPSQRTPESDLEDRLADTRERGKRALRGYLPKPYAGRIALVHATDINEWIELTDPSGTLGWGAICEGGVSVVSINCKHLDLFKEPNIAELVQRLDEALAPTRTR